MVTMDVVGFTDIVTVQDKCNYKGNVCYGKYNQNSSYVQNIGTKRNCTSSCTVNAIVSLLHVALGLNIDTQAITDILVAGSKVYHKIIDKQPRDTMCFASQVKLKGDMYTTFIHDFGIEAFDSYRQKLENIFASPDHPNFIVIVAGSPTHKTSSLFKVNGKY